MLNRFTRKSSDRENIPRLIGPNIFQNIPVEESPFNPGVYLDFGKVFNFPG